MIGVIIQESTVIDAIIRTAVDLNTHLACVNRFSNRFVVYWKLMAIVKQSNTQSALLSDSFCIKMVGKRRCEQTAKK